MSMSTHTKIDFFKYILFDSFLDKGDTLIFGRFTHNSIFLFATKL